MHLLDHQFWHQHQRLWGAIAVMIGIGAGGTSPRYPAFLGQWPLFILIGQLWLILGAPMQKDNTQ